MHFFYNNKNTIRVFFFLIFLLGKSGMGLFAQTALVGKVTDAESGEELIGANIVVKKNGNFIQGETTDIDGNYSVRVDSGTYDVEVSYTGYSTQGVEGVLASAGLATKVDVRIKIKGGIIIENYGCFLGWVIPLIRFDDFAYGQKVTSNQIKNLPTRNIKEILLTTPGVSFSQ